LALDPEDYRYTDLMLTEVDRLNRVISKLLAYSKPREPRLVVRPVDEILDHCIRVLEREAGEAQVEIVRNRHGDQVPLVLMDTDQMTQVMLNLLINAIEAAPKESRVIAGYESDDQGQVMIVVEDAGEGIPREHLDKLFDPFFSTKSKGTGLGLTVCRQIVDLHDGRIKIQSTEGEGTTVTVSLPLRKGI